MKKHIIKIVSFVLVFVLSVLALSSCGINISGQTGGFHDSNYFHEYWWEETYAECVDGIKSLKSYGSTFGKTILVSYEGNLFDMKYCIFTDRRNSDKEVGISVGRYERKVEKVSVMCFAFFEEVSLYKLKRSYVGNYKAYEIIPELEYAINNNLSYDELTVDLLECHTTQKDYSAKIEYEYRLKADNTLLLTIKPSQNQNGQLSNEAVQAIIDSIDIEMYEQMKDCMID